MIIMYLFPVAIGFTIFMLRLLDLKYEMKKNYFKKIANTKFAYHTIMCIVSICGLIMLMVTYFIDNLVIKMIIVLIVFILLAVMNELYPRRQTWNDVYQVYINPPKNIDNLTLEQKKYMYSISRLQAFLILALAILNALVFYKNTMEMIERLNAKTYSSCYNEKEQLKW